jgi:hypothetical protein
VVCGGKGRCEVEEPDPGGWGRMFSLVTSVRVLREEGGGKEGKRER